MPLITTIVDVEEYTTSELDGSVKLRMEISDEAAVSVPTFFLESVRKYEGRTAMAVFRNGYWKKWTYGKYLNHVKVIARAFLRLGLEMYHGVCILGFNSPEWFISELAAVFAGGLAAGIYYTNSPEDCLACLRKANADIVVVENQEQLEKILQIRDEVPDLKAIVQYTGEPSEEKVLSWKELYKIGEDALECHLRDRLMDIVINKPCNIVFTSGTTGSPRGVLLSHDNITWKGRYGEAIGWREGEEVLVSYMPLSHIAAKITDIYCSLNKGAAVYFAKPEVFKTSLRHTLKEIRPTIFFGVPRVWEKLYEEFEGIRQTLPGFQRTALSWCQEASTTYHTTKGASGCFKYKMAKSVILEMVKVEFGLDRSRYLMTTGAPSSRKIYEFFLSIDLPLREVYGLSECAGPHTTYLKNYSHGSVGKVMEGCRTKIYNQNEVGNGEICIQGRHVFMGYVDDDTKTDAVIDNEGYFHSGDLGSISSSGCLTLTGRLTEVIVTSGGVIVDPLEIEDQVKMALPIVSHCIVIGHRKKFLSLLLTLKTLPSSGYEPLKLHSTVVKWCADIGAKATRLSELLDPFNQPVMSAIQQGIDKANSYAISGTQTIKKWFVLSEDFSVKGGELGPTFKMRRSYIVEKYTYVIKKMYKK